MQSILRRFNALFLPHIGLLLTEPIVTCFSVSSRSPCSIPTLMDFSLAVASLCLGCAVLFASIDGPCISRVIRFQSGRSRLGITDNMVHIWLVADDDEV